MTSRRGSSGRGETCSDSESALMVSARRPDGHMWSVGERQASTSRVTWKDLDEGLDVAVMR